MLYGIRDEETSSNAERELRYCTQDCCNAISELLCYADTLDRRTTNRLSCFIDFAGQEGLYQSDGHYDERRVTSDPIEIAGLYATAHAYFWRFEDFLYDFGVQSDESGDAIVAQTLFDAFDRYCKYVLYAVARAIGAGHEIDLAIETIYDELCADDDEND